MPCCKTRFNLVLAGALVLATAIIKHYNGGNGGFVRAGGYERFSPQVIALFFIQDAAC